MSSRFVAVTVLGLSLVAATAGCGEDPVEPTPDAGTCETPGVDCDVTLEPPEVGIQLSVGPFNVERGTEKLQCFWMKAPRDLDVNEWEVKYNNGSHHLDIYRAEYEMPDGDFDCSNANEWGSWESQLGKGGLEVGSPWPVKVVGFQNETLKWKLPDGIAYRIPKGTQLLIQSHYANGVTQKTPTLRARAFINLSTVDKAKEIAQTLFDEDDHLVLPARTVTTYERYCYFPEEVNVIASFGHFHSRGQTHEIFLWDPDKRATIGEEPFYKNDNWSDPPWSTADSGWFNGAKGSLATRGVMMRSTYNNFEDREITWGYFVDENEHFETQVVFYPSLELDARCYCGRMIDGEPHLPEGRSMMFTPYPGLVCPDDAWFDNLKP